MLVGLISRGAIVIIGAVIAVVFAFLWVRGAAARRELTYDAARSRAEKREEALPSAQAIAVALGRAVRRARSSSSSRPSASAA